MKQSFTDEAYWAYSDESLPNVSRETRARLHAFLNLFDKWSEKINLVGASTRSQVVKRHILDSLQLTDLAPGSMTWVDLGSGAGFPGLVLGIVMAESTAGWVHLVESNHKKSAFLRAAILRTGARASVSPIRAEVAFDVIGPCDAVSSRALASLNDLFLLGEKWLCADGRTKAWFHKGRDYQREIDEARGSWRFDLVKHASRIEPNSVILEIANLERR